MSNELDALILESLKDRPRQFTALHTGAVREECDRLERESINGVGLSGCKPSFRFLDGRLQALRRKGLIQYDTKKGWALQ